MGGGICVESSQGASKIFLVLNKMFSDKPSPCTTRSSKASKQASKHQNQVGICVESSQGASKIFLVLNKMFSDKQSLCMTRSSKASKQASKSGGGICDDS